MQNYSFLVMPGFSAMAFFSAVEPLRIANRLAGETLFGWSVHVPRGDHAEASNGMQIRADGPLDERAQASVVCAGFEPLRHASRALLAALRRVWRLGGSVGAIDTGAFLLAEAGILGREAITLHWEAADEFALRYPAIPVSDELYERHARLFTCAGGTAAMDMMLAGIAAQHGPALAKAVSDQLIHERIRSASDPQRGDDPALLGHPLVARVVRIMQARITEPLSLDALAYEAGLDRRRIERMFRAVLGGAPAHYYRDLRLRHGVALIRQQGLSVQAAALASGYSSQAVFSRACKVHFGASPRTIAQRAGW
jgi:transcriptional regulator GlxA family with amidase domain